MRARVCGRRFVAVHRSFTIDGSSIERAAPSMNQAYTTLAPIGKLMVDAINSYGLDPAAIMDAAGFDRNALSDPNERFQAESMRKVWSLAVEASADPAFGIRVAESSKPGSSHALGLAWITSASLMDALMRLDRYDRFLSTAVSITLDGNTAPPRLNIEDRLETPDCPEPMDACLAIVLKMARAVWGDELTPEYCAMKRPAPAAADVFDGYFRCPISYGEDRNAICFRSDDLDRSLSGANEGLARECDQILERHLAVFDRNDYVLRARVAITRLLPSGRISEKEVAKTLNVSSRTLQRRLRQEGTSYQTIMQETRHELAIQHLKFSKFSITETAYLLGFENTSNFTRAFKSWTGMTPSQSLEAPSPAR